MKKSTLVYTEVGEHMPNSVKAAYCTIRVHAVDASPKGRGYKDRCKEIFGPMPWGGRTARNEYIRTKTELEARGIIEAV